MCSRFNDAPEVALQTLLRRAKEAGARDIALKTMLLVLPRPDEAMAVKYDDGTRVEDDEEGYDLKRDQIHLRLNAQGVSEIAVEFFNAREEGPAKIRERIIEKISEYRLHYASQIPRIAAAVSRLAENRQSDTVRLVFERVLSDLNTWVQNHEEIELSEDHVQQPLVSAIDNTRYASTVRAAVRRAGDWYNLDYYHHLSFGVRKLAVEQIGGKLEHFRIIAGNLAKNPDLAAARAFLEGIVSRLDAAVNEAYRRIQMTGREAFKQSLAKDYAFWSRCQNRWGQGPGYRSAIRDMTDEEFAQECLRDVQTQIASAIHSEWKTIIELMRASLQEKELAGVARA
jgi:hypothetical protein